MVPSPHEASLVHERLNGDLWYFAERAPLYIKDAQGQMLKWVPNLAQRYTHDRLEEQARQHGWVRAVVVKGRQQGLSTYINARFYHKTTRRPGTSTFILSHEGKTTDKLFAMVERFQDNVNPALRPEVGKQNTRQLTFPGLNSDYAAGTAGNEDVGRGGTAQLLHGSETAYWANAYAIQDGALESIRLAPGTEIILESTANGPVGLFYDKVKRAINGEGDYILIFIPWFWEDAYERADDGSALTEEEEKYVTANFAKAFPYQREPISREKARRKIMWRRSKIIDLTKGNNNAESGKAKFRSIYPSNPIEAFMSTATGIVNPSAIVNARARAKVQDEFAARIGGCDPAGEGKKADRTILAIRQGRNLEKVLKWDKMQPMELAGKLAKLIVEERLDMLFIDRGYGEGTMYRLWELGFKKKVIGVWFQESATNEIYLNKRSEIIIETAKWLNNDDTSIPDDDDVHADFAIMPVDRENSNGVKCIPPKEEIIKALGRSPDIFDGTALTFAYPVRRTDSTLGADGLWKKAQTLVKAHGGPLSSMNRRRARQ